MRRNILYVAIAIVALGGVNVSEAKEQKSKSGHKFKGSVELQYRTNENIGIAPASGQGFDFAELSEFGTDDGDAEGADEDEEEEDDDDGSDDDFDDAFDDLVDVEPDEDEIEFDDAIDEDGDGIDDLLDPDADILVERQNRVTAKLAASHKYTFASGGMHWNNALQLSSDTHNQRSELDKFNFALTTGLEFSRKESRHKFKPSISWVSLEKDDRSYASTFVVSLAYTFKASERIQLGATYNYQDKDLASPTSPDATVDTLSLTAEFEATDDDIFKLKYAPKVEDSSQSNRSTDTSGFEFTYTRKLPWDMTAGIGYEVGTIEFRNLEPRREDDNTTWALQVTKDFSKKLTAELGFESRERESNIPGKDAENDSYYIGATYKF